MGLAILALWYCGASLLGCCFLLLGEMRPSCSWSGLKEGRPCFSARKSAQTGPGAQRGLVSSAPSGLSAWLP